MAKKGNVMIEDDIVVDVHDKFFKLMAEQSEKTDPLLVAGVMMALATRLYKSAVPDDEFDRIMDFIVTNSDKIQEFGFKKTLH